VGQRPDSFTAANDTTATSAQLPSAKRQRRPADGAQLAQVDVAPEAHQTHAEQDGLGVLEVGERTFVDSTPVERDRPTRRGKAR
jgi:hypothetical protein